MIDTATDTVLRTISVRPGVKAPIGSSPNALAVSPDGKTLYVANGANNAVAVVDLHPSEPRLRGLIRPAGIRPRSPLCRTDLEVWVASGYGFGSIAPLAQGQKGRSYRDRADGIACGGTEG